MYEESRERSVVVVLIKLQVQIQHSFTIPKCSIAFVMIITTTLIILANYKLISSNFHIYHWNKLFQSQSAFSLVLLQNAQNLHVPMTGHSDRILRENELALNNLFQPFFLFHFKKWYIAKMRNPSNLTVLSTLYLLILI